MVCAAGWLNRKKKKIHNFIIFFSKIGKKNFIVQTAKFELVLKIFASLLLLHWIVFGPAWLVKKVFSGHFLSKVNLLIYVETQDALSFITVKWKFFTKIEIIFVVRQFLEHINNLRFNFDQVF